MASTGVDYADQLTEQKVLRWYADMPYLSPRLSQFNDPNLTKAAG